MKVIIATEEVPNEHEYIIKNIYHYKDSTKSEKNVFAFVVKVASK